MNKVLFFALLLLPLSQLYADQCRNSIKRNTCLVGHYIKAQKNVSVLTYHKQKMQRPCDRESYKYANRLLKVYDLLPAHTKKAFCYIKKNNYLQRRLSLWSSSISIL